MFHNYSSGLFSRLSIVSQLGLYTLLDCTCVHMWSWLGMYICVCVCAWTWILNIMYGIYDVHFSSWNIWFWTALPQIVNLCFDWKPAYTEKEHDWNTLVIWSHRCPQYCCHVFHWAFWQERGICKKMSFKGQQREEKLQQEPSVRLQTSAGRGNWPHLKWYREKSEPFQPYAQPEVRHFSV